MKSVLIVDDSKAMRMLVRRALRVSGYGYLEVREADSGEAAFEEITAHRPDLVLCDWNMPGWSGLDLLSAMNRAGLWATTIFVTSESTPQMHELEPNCVTAGRRTAANLPGGHTLRELSADGNWDPGTVCYTRRLANHRRVSGASRPPPPAARWHVGQSTCADSSM